MITPARHATYEDVLNAPEQMVAELIDGQLYLQPRPAKRHAKAATILGALLIPPYGLGEGGPGGWEILHEPEIHFGPNVLVPDLAGWRTAAGDPYAGLQTYFTMVPQWVCEVLSKSTARKDRDQKLPLYAQAGVEHAWLIDPEAQQIEVFVQKDGAFRCVQTHKGQGVLTAPPFEATAMRTGLLWPG